MYSCYVFVLLLYSVIVTPFRLTLVGFSRCLVARILSRHILCDGTYGPREQGRVGVSDKARFTQQ